jgi:DNA-binding GntR family transcriptional regulator
MRRSTRTTARAKARRTPPRRGTRRKNVALPQVVAWVRDRIAQGRLVPGQRLVEADIVAATGASRARVREALRRLEAEGLVTIEEFRGASVKKLGPDEVRQIYEARMVLEGLAAAACALRADESQRQKLRAIQKALNDGESSGSHDQFAKRNAEWHALIIAGSGNEYIAQFLGRLTVPIYRLLFSTFYTAERIKAANADHRIITAAIVEGRAEDAERAMRDHIRAGLEALIELDAHFDA